MIAAAAADPSMQVPSAVLLLIGAMFFLSGWAVRSLVGELRPRRWRAQRRWVREEPRL